MWFFDFQKNCRFHVFQKNQNQRTSQFQVFLKNQNQSTSQFLIFQNPQRTSSFHEKTDGSFLVFFRFFDFKTFVWVGSGVGYHKNIIAGWALVVGTRKILFAGSVLGARV